MSQGFAHIRVKHDKLQLHIVSLIGAPFVAATMSVGTKASLAAANTVLPIQLLNGNGIGDVVLDAVSQTCASNFRLRED